MAMFKTFVVKETSVVRPETYLCTVVATTSQPKSTVNLRVITYPNYVSILSDGPMQYLSSDLTDAQRQKIKTAVQRLAREVKTETT